MFPYFFNMYCTGFVLNYMTSDGIIFKIMPQLGDFQSCYKSRQVGNNVTRRQLPVANVMTTATDNIQSLIMRVPGHIALHKVHPTLDVYMGHYHPVLGMQGMQGMMILFTNYYVWFLRF